MSITPDCASRYRYKSIPPMGWRDTDNGVMSKLKQIQDVLSVNLARLKARWMQDEMRKGVRKTGVNAFAKHLGVGNSALESIKDGDGNPSLETLFKIADKFGLEPWQLFIKDIDIDHKPRVLTSSELSWYSRVEALRRDLPEPSNGSETGKFAPPPAPTKRPAHRLRRKPPR